MKKHSKICEHKMNIAINRNQEQSNISEISAAIREILALAKEIELLISQKESVFPESFKS